MLTKIAAALLLAGGFIGSALFILSGRNVALAALQDALQKVESATYTITHHKAGARIDAVFTFIANDDRTTVRVELDLQSGGLPPGTLAPVRWAIADKVRDVIGHDLADLKEFIEGRSLNAATIARAPVAPLTEEDDTQGG